MSRLHPHNLQYTIEHEIHVSLGISGLPGSVRFAIDRFVEDERRFRVGLMAIVDSDTTDQLYIGFNAAANVGCLGYAPHGEAVKSPARLPDEKYWAKGSGVDVPYAEFHFFVPDSPAVFGRKYLLPLARVRELATAYLETGTCPDGIVWVPNEVILRDR
jgi:hypothetical protein